MQYDTTQDDRLWGTLAYVLGIFFAVLAPLIIFFVKKDQSRFVAFHALQSLMMDVAVIVMWFAIAFLSAILGFMHLGLVGLLLLPVGWVVSLGVLILKVIGAVKSNSGELWVAPLVGSFVRQRAAV
jgi:hypothetical protein